VPRGDLLDGPAAVRAIDFFPVDAPRVPRGHALAQRSFCTNDRCFQITADFGRAPADPSVLEAVNRVLATLTVAPLPRPEREALPEWTRHTDERSGVALAYPREWRLLDRQLLPALADPKAVLALATFAAPPGGERCAHLPENALEAMGERDALVVLMERSGNSGYPPRPERFGPERGYRTEAVECLERPKAFDDWLIEFEDSSRHFLAYVGIGSSASKETRDQVWAILDSLVIESAPG